MRVAVNNENMIEINNNITPSMGDDFCLLFNKLSQARNSCKTFLIGDKKLKSENIQLMCDELLQRVIPKEGCREYELIEIETLPDLVSSRVSYSKYSKSVTELFNILENELKKVSGMEYFVLTRSQQKNVDKIKDTFSQISTQTDKNIRYNSYLATNLNLNERIKILGIDTLNS
ncbi:hypothetical protein KMU_07570 [Proteus vulgaris]|uniref:hypothetical protein n=1 Tax=Proteus vulgaris TaxID=585 RepID=UPI00255451C7|nr:hypothetical protein [Proteus vulgaris]GLX62716.1 hypothetical protein KMU_07570 [Proteus vulgaris]